MGLNFWSMQGTLGRVNKRICQNFLVNHPHGPFALKIVQPALVPLGIWMPGYKQLLNYMHWLWEWLASGFIPVFDQKNQVLFKHIQGHISHFLRTPFNAKKSLESMSFLVLSQHEQFYLKGLSVFVGLDKVSTKIQELSSTDCKFQGLSRPWISILKFKDLKPYGFRAFSVIAPILWNNLPVDIRSIDDVNKCKSKLKTFLFKRVYELS